MVKHMHINYTISVHACIALRVRCLLLTNQAYEKINVTLVACRCCCVK